MQRSDKPAPMRTSVWNPSRVPRSHFDPDERWKSSAEQDSSYAKMQAKSLKSPQNQKAIMKDLTPLLPLFERSRAYPLL
jgi:hypothetical protein